MNHFRDKKPVRSGARSLSDRSAAGAVHTNNNSYRKYSKIPWQTTQIKRQCESIRHDPGSGLDWLAITLDQDRRR
jgi:hypothetical protein